MEFCKQFNAKTQNDKGMIIPVVITVYADKSFTFITKVSPVPALIKKAAGIESGSGEPNRKKVGKIKFEPRRCKQPQYGRKYRLLRGVGRAWRDQLYAPAKL